MVYLSHTHGDNRVLHAVALFQQNDACETQIAVKTNPSGVTGKLSKVSGTFVCKRCTGGVRKKENLSKAVDIGNGVILEKVDRFYYVGDKIGTFGELSQATAARIRSGWARFRVKFRQIARFLTAKDRQ